MSKRLLFVCMGNICRSPTAKGVFDRALTAAGIDFESESAGTHGYHVGERPDRRAIDAAARSGIDISADLARRFVVEDYQRFDCIFAMDRANLAVVESLRPAAVRVSARLVMDLAPDYGLDEVPDPYYGGEAGFIRVIDMLEAAAAALVRELRA
ncbi:MAG: low molecular weight phosphotyrosine protein phosphatase [Gammaproteobacteria bacterium]|nr:low molecular weight phosphotyrosine protein phosphatase [Gammaproteobacteria bacterium]